MCAMVNEPVTLTDKALEANKWKTNLARFKPAFANTYKVVMTTCHCGRKKQKKHHPKKHPQHKRHPTPQPYNLVVKRA